MSDFHLLLEEQLPGLMRYASVLTGDSEQAGDLVEETLIEVLNRRRRPDQAADLRVRLLTVLHELRGNPFRQADPAAKPHRRSAGPAAMLTLSALDRALRQLPEEQRAVILLIGLQTMSYPQTATILGISVAAVRSRLARGLDNLRRAMGVRDEVHLSRAA